MSQAIEHFLQQNQAELVTEGDKPFQAVRGLDEGPEIKSEAKTQASPAGAETSAIATETSEAAATAEKPEATSAKPFKKSVPPPEETRRDSTLQKIARLDIKGRIAMAMRGSKEERSILIRDGTKLVAIAVLDSPKISDGEVEKFALQKNVLEAVLRAIPMKRRFAKSYTIMRNLVYNPRTPLDLGSDARPLAS